MIEDPRSLADEVGGLDELLVEALSLLPTVREAVETVRSPGWAAIETTIRVRLEEVKVQAIMATTMEQLAEHRGKIRAFNTFLAIPRSVESQLAQLIDLAEEYDQDVGDHDEGE